MRKLLSPSFAISVLALAVAIGGGAAWATTAAPQVTTVKCFNVAATAFQNHWKNYPSTGGFHKAEICRDSLGYVHLAGVVTAGPTDTTVFFLPKTDRPRVNHAFAVAAGTGSPALDDVDVFSNGSVFVFGPNNAAVALDGISFRVGD
jgi:hypothetical protein